MDEKGRKAAFFCQTFQNKITIQKWIKSCRKSKGVYAPVWTTGGFHLFGGVSTFYQDFLG